MKAKFYICEHCGNLVTTIHNAGVPLVCCGEKMKELLPNTVEASGEKHLPVAELSGSTLTVTVGAVEHPMVDVHHFQHHHPVQRQQPGNRHRCGLGRLWQD